MMGQCTCTSVTNESTNDNLNHPPPPFILRSDAPDQIAIPSPSQSVLAPVEVSEVKIHPVKTELKTCEEKVQEVDVETEVTFVTLKGKLRKYLRSLPRKPGFKYVRFTEHYGRTDFSWGGMAFDEFGPEEIVEYQENLEQLAKDIQNSDAWIESYSVAFADYYAGKLVYPVTPKDVEFVREQVNKLLNF